MKMIIYISFLLSIGTLSAENYRDSFESQYQENSSRQIQNMSDITVKVFNNQKLGKILTDNKGMTLYIFTPDRNNASTCYDQCEMEWPPLLISKDQPKLATGIPGTLGTINRQDNTHQVTYNGRPLYYYVGDNVAGDVNGQQLENKWFVVNIK